MGTAQKITPAVSVTGCKSPNPGKLWRAVAVVSGADKVGAPVASWGPPARAPGPGLDGSGQVELSWTNAINDGDGPGEFSWSQANDVCAGLVGIGRLGATGSSRIWAKQRSSRSLCILVNGLHRSRGTGLIRHFEARQTRRVPVCTRGWTPVGRGSHSIWGPPIRGPRAGPSGVTSQRWAQDRRKCC